MRLDRADLYRRERLGYTAGALGGAVVYAFARFAFGDSVSEVVTAGLIWFVVWAAVLNLFGFPGDPIAQQPRQHRARLRSLIKTGDARSMSIDQVRSAQLVLDRMQRRLDSRLDLALLGLFGLAFLVFGVVLLIVSSWSLGLMILVMVVVLGAATIYDRRQQRRRIDRARSALRARQRARAGVEVHD